MKKNTPVTANKVVLRNAADPFLLHLRGDPYILRAADLMQQVDKRLQGKRTWFYPAIRVLSYSDALLHLSVKDKDSSFEMAVKIEPDKLHVACSCATQVETICLHMYRALNRIAGPVDTDYFSQYRPHGAAEMYARHADLFLQKVTSDGNQYIPKKFLGNVFGLSGKSKEAAFPELRSYPLENKENGWERKADHCYMLITSYRSTQFPGLVPCSGILNKTGDELKLFHPFLAGLQQEQYGVWTPDQERLNAAGLEMWKWIERLPGTFSEVTEVQRPFLLALFCLWEVAIPILHQQEFIYHYNIHSVRQLKGRPDKKYTHRYRVSKERPQLHFKLQDKGAYFLFWPVLTIRGVVHTQFKYWTSFFVLLHQDVFLLSSLRDTAVLEWMEQVDGRLAIFKEHFPEFEEDILLPLQAYYQIAAV